MILQALSNLAHFCDGSVKSLSDLGITQWVIAELLKIEPDCEDVRYIIDIVSLVQSLTSKTSSDNQTSEMIKFFI